MKKSNNRKEMTLLLSGVVSIFLLMQAILFQLVRVPGLSLDERGGRDRFYVDLALLAICIAGACVWSYWISGRLFRRWSGGDERFLGYAELGAALEEQPVPVPDIFQLVMGSSKTPDAAYVRELEKRNAIISSMFMHSSDAIYLVDLEGNVSQANPAFEKLYGYALQEIAEEPLHIVPERLREETCRLYSLIRDGQTVSGYETARRTKYGHEIHVSLTLSPIFDQQGQVMAIAGISRNISERKAIEEMLRQSEKLSVVGQLAAGVAHEIRNPLTTLRGFVQLQQLRRSGNPDHLELMLEELDRINFIVSEFIVLSKPHLNQFILKDLNGLLMELSRLLESQANLNNIILETQLDPFLPKIRCEENQLKQVFLNVIKNGMEAMPEGGVVLLEGRLLDPGRVLIRITDHGRGIPEELLLRLGEPFLSNKENGTGLGIMVSRQIVANHKGQLLVRSELGKGTCVDIVLPVDFEKVEEE